MTSSALSRARPAAPRPDLIAGHFPQYGRDPLAFLTRCAREYGEVVPLRFGPFPVLFVSSPAAVEEVLVTKQRSFRRSRAMRRLRAIVGDSLLTSDGDAWLRRRRRIQPGFHRKLVRSHAATMVRHTDALLDRWHDGDVRDIHAEMTQLTLGIVCEALFDTDVSSDVETFGRTGRTLSEYFEDRFGGLSFFIPDALPTPANLRRRRAVRELDAVVARIIAERRAAPPRHDLLGLLLGVDAADGGEGLTDQEVRDELLTLLLAGHETTAIALSWAWALLASHPDAERRLHEELDEVLGDRAPTADDVVRLPFTTAVWNETLRLYPPAYAISREAVEPVEVGGHLVRRHGTVMVSQWVMHRDGRWFADPDLFRPERWLDGLVDRLPRGVYFPFGLGPHLCVGARFAVLEGVLLLARIAQRFRLSLRPGASLATQAAVTLRPRGGIPVILHARPSGRRGPHVA